VSLYSSSRRYRAQALAVSILTAAVLLPGDAAAQGDEPLARGRALYESAAYTEAIAVLADRTEAEALQYRALSLLALRRTSEAQQAVELLVRTSPSFLPPEDDLPPRFVTLFQETRIRALPETIRALLAQGRQKFQEKNYDAARQHFDQALRLTAEPAAASVTGIDDLRTLATSYLDLVKETVALKAPPPAAAAPVAAPVVARPAVITSPRVVRQSIPPWPSVAGSREVGATGAVRVVIGVDGKVKKATIERPLNPRYDQQVLVAARSWLYAPATLNGAAVEVEKVVEIAP
jgi:tetratricopeptide (TPR) repeat protein